jgi:hypothetical protein
MPECLRRIRTISGSLFSNDLVEGAGIIGDYLLDTGNAFVVLSSHARGKQTV